MRAWLVLVLLAGCGRLGFGSQTDVDGGTDVPADARPQLPPFTTARPIPNLASIDEDDDPSVSRDGLELFFASRRTGTSELWVSQRASRADEWPAPTLVTELDTATDHKGPELSLDSLTLYYEEAGDIAFSTRSDRQSPWTAPQQLISGNYGTPAICGDGLRLYVRLGVSPLLDLGVTERASVADAWPTPVPVSELNTAMDETGPWLTADCNRMYFDTDRTQAGVPFVVDRDTTTGLFGVPTPFTELRAVAGASHDLSLTADERYLVFSHNTTTAQLYDSSR